jgi:hypothetical protein
MDTTVSRDVAPCALVDTYRAEVSYISADSIFELNVYSVLTDASKSEFYAPLTIEKQEIYLKHPYLISKLYDAASRVTNFGEINSVQDR